MAKRLYAYRLRKTVPSLVEEEWVLVEPFLLNRMHWIKKYRKETGCSIAEAAKNEPVGQSALDKYAEITGIRLEHPDELWAFRLSSYGSLCPECEKPFRTPKAKMCAECGYQLPTGLLVDLNLDNRIDFHFNAMLDNIAEWRKKDTKDTDLLSKIIGLIVQVLVILFV